MDWLAALRNQSFLSFLDFLDSCNFCSWLFDPLYTPCVLWCSPFWYQWTYCLSKKIVYKSCKKINLHSNQMWTSSMFSLWESNIYVKSYLVFIIWFSFSELWIEFDMDFLTFFLLTSYNSIVDFSELPFGSCLPCFPSLSLLVKYYMIF